MALLLLSYLAPEEEAINKPKQTRHVFLNALFEVQGGLMGFSGPSDGWVRFLGLLNFGLSFLKVHSFIQGGLLQ